MEFPKAIKFEAERYEQIVWVNETGHFSEMSRDDYIKKTTKADWEWPEYLDRQVKRLIETETMFAIFPYRGKVLHKDEVIELLKKEIEEEKAKIEAEEDNDFLDKMSRILE